MVITEIPVIQVQVPLPCPLASGAFGTLYLIDGRVIWRMEGLKNPVIDVLGIREAIAAINKITQNSKTPLLIDLKCEGVVMLTPTAKAALLGTDFVKMRSAIAFVCDEVARKTVFMHLVSFNKYNVPLKSFSSEGEAMSWLAGFLLN